MNIEVISKEIYQNNRDKGFWDTERNKGEMLMLIVSELSEALEADRKNRYSDKDKFFEFNEGGLTHGPVFKAAFEDSIKDTFEDEIADAVIRLFDISVGLGIDLEWHIRKKTEYNKTRQKMHGKKY